MIFAVYRYLICGKDAGGVLFCVIIMSVCMRMPEMLFLHFGKKAIASLPRFEYTYRDKQIKRDKPGRGIGCFLWQFSRKLCR